MTKDKELWIPGRLVLGSGDKEEKSLALEIEKVNSNNLYKDRIRTWELEARIAMNGGRNE